MAIYRPERSRLRPRLIALAVGLLVGGTLVFLLLPDGEESPEERAGRVQAELAAANGLLEVAGIEYEESVGGDEVVLEAEYKGALDSLDRSRTAFESVREDLATIKASAIEPIEAGYDEVEQAMRAVDPHADVLAAINSLSDLLGRATP